MTPAIDLRPDHRKVVEDILNKHLPHGVKVWVFGSRAEWTTKDSSDLDLALEGDGPLDTRSLIELELAFEDSLLPFRVDVVDLARVEDGFREILEANRKPWRKGPIGRRDWIQGVLADACKAIDYGLTASASSDARGPKFLRITDIVSGHIDWSSVPYVTVDDAMRAKYKLHDGDIVIARTGASTGASAFVKAPPDAVFASYLVRLQARKGYDARFLAYSLKSDQFWNFLRGVLGDKSAQPNASASTITRGPLRAPKCQTEQRAIGRVLGALDDRIDMNRRMNETLEAMAQALFKSWFVDFDPVRAKMEGRDTGLPPDIADLFPDRLAESELGEIPEGWVAIPLAEVIDINPVRTLARGVTAPYLDMASMPTRGHVPRGTRMRASASGARFRNGDTLLARITPCLENGKTAFVNWLRNGEVGWGSTEFIVLSPRDPVPGEFAYCLARAPEFREHAIKSMTGTSGRQRVPKEALAEFEIPRATPSIYAVFGEIVHLVFARAMESQRNSQVVASLRDALLPGLVSGEVRLPATVVDGYAQPHTRVTS